MGGRRHPRGDGADAHPAHQATRRPLRDPRLCLSHATGHRRDPNQNPNPNPNPHPNPNTNPNPNTSPNPSPSPNPNPSPSPKRTQATDATFTTQLVQIHTGNSLFTRPRGLAESEGFVLHHFAGEVCYSSAGFMHANTEKLSPELEVLPTCRTPTQTSPAHLTLNPPT